MDLQSISSINPLMARLMPNLKPHALDAHTALNARCNAVPLIEKA
jgi:hypothetical protein